MKSKSALRSFLLFAGSSLLAVTSAQAAPNPVSTPGGPYLVLAGGNLTLVGSGTPSDTGTTITTYEWDLDDDGDFDESITGPTPTAIPYATLTGTYSMTKGSNTISLRVTDDSSPTPLTTTTTTTVVLDTTTYTGASGSGGGTDTWNIAGRWDAGIPALTSDAVIAPSKYVVVNAATGPYSGSLSIGSGSTLQIGWTTVDATRYNALGNGNVTMAAGSSILTRNEGTMNLASLTLTGNASIRGGDSTQRGTQMNFGAITGSHTLSLYNHNSNFTTGNSNLNAANSFSALVLTATDNTSSTVFAKVAGSLGTGDVTLNSGKLTFGTAAGALDIMADTGVLAINGSGNDRVTMTASDTIAGVTLNGAKQLPGVYGSAETWLAGVGTLTVLGVTSAYWDIDDIVAGAGGTAPAGIWGGTSNWSSAAAGNVTTTTWTAGQNAIFAAGTTATGPYGVAISGTQDVSGLGFEEGNVTLSGDALNLMQTAPVVVKTGASALIESVITENVGPFALHKSGAGALTLSGANTYTGGTLLAEGTLNINAGGVAGVSGPLGNGGTFTLNGGTIDNTSGSALVLLNVNPISIGGNSVFSTVASTANNNLTLPGAVNLGGTTRTITTNGAADLTLSGTITNGTLTKAGAGTLVLTGTNTHTGGTTLTGGKLVIVGPSALGSGTLTWGTTNTTLHFQQDSNMSVTNTLNTSARSTTRTMIVDRVTAGAAVNLAFSSIPNLDCSTVLNFQKGANITTDTPTLTFTNGTGSSDSNHGSLLGGAANGPITLNPTDLNLVINGISSSGRTRAYILTGNSTGNRITGTFSNGSGTTVNKRGTGTWTLAGVGNYTGTTTVETGILAMGANNAIHNSSNVIIGNATLDAATFDDTVGTLDVTAAATINLGAGANLAFSGATATWAGTLNLTGTFDFSGGPTSSLRFGTTSATLTSNQLLAISAAGFTNFGLDVDGYLTATPDGGGSPYETWAGAGVTFDADANNDGVSNGTAFLLGASGPNVSAHDKMPVVTHNAGALVMTFSMRNAANRGTATLSVQHSSDLGMTDPWESALVPDTDQTVNDVVFDITVGDPLNGVQATIPASKANAGKLFGRLVATE